MALFLESESCERKNVNLSDEQNYFEYGWMGSYNQRGQCVRLLCPVSTKKHQESTSEIDYVKFITKEPNSYEGPGYNWEDPPEQTDMAICDFYEFIDMYCRGFEKAEIPNEYWSKMTSCLQLQNFKYERIQKVDCWTTNTNMTKELLDEKLLQMSIAQRSCFSLFGTALKGGMRNGQAKFWLDVLVNEFLQMDDDFTKLEACGYAPPNHCSTNTIIETVQGDVQNPITGLRYNAPFTTSSSELADRSSSLSIESDMFPESAWDPKVNIQTIVPDYCVILKDYPGVFPLVVEFTTAHQEDRGQQQNITQMLSKLFFQDIVFGMVISPRLFQMSVINKQQGNLHFACTDKIKLTTLKDGKLQLSLAALTDMCTFIYRILIWGRKTKCKSVVI